jgi:hypothetical protein
MKILFNFLSKRLFSAIVGCGGWPFSSFDAFFWIPIVAPIIGGILGSYLYLFTVGFHLSERESMLEESGYVE